MLNADLLKEKISAAGYTIAGVSVDLEMDISTFYRKIGGASVFSIDDVYKMKRLLNLSSEDAESIFFAENLA